MPPPIACTTRESTSPHTNTIVYVVGSTIDYGAEEGGIAESSQGFRPDQAEVGADVGIVSKCSQARLQTRVQGRR